MNADDRSWITRRRVRDIDERADRLSPVRAGADFFHRPGELLISRAAEDRFAEVLEKVHGGRPIDERDVNGRLRAAGIDLRLWAVDAAVDLPVLVDRLRDEGAEDGTGSGVGLNHVLFGEPKYKGGPGDEPAPCDPVRFEPAARPIRTDGPADLAVLDTGLPEEWATLHPQLAGALAPDADDVDELDGDGDQLLDTEAGHGVFICGLVHRVAPMLTVDPGKVLDATGVGDDVTVALELAETGAQVVNLSLGGYTQGDRPPLALAAALARLPRTVVVVAAAGNDGGDRPFFPAALKGVLAVAAYDPRRGDRAEFTNHGPWVDCCAPGVDLRSSYVRGEWQAHDGPRSFKGFARWSGTSFAAPLVAAEIARRVALSGGTRSAREVADDLMAELPQSSWPGLGLRYEPPLDLTQ